MDRNSTLHDILKLFPVALRKESVDRNAQDWLDAGTLSRSLSARRAWIEIDIPPNLDADHASLSARRAWIEIVNTADQEARKRSLSARRAWIEIPVILII